jgi:hypothetical protein
MYVTLLSSPFYKWRQWILGQALQKSQQRTLMVGKGGPPGGLGTDLPHVRPLYDSDGEMEHNSLDFHFYMKLRASF